MVTSVLLVALSLKLSVCYTSPYSHYENSIVGQLEDNDRWTKIKRFECPSPYINILLATHATENS